MMVLEQLLPDEFELILGWLARGTLRSEMSRLEEAAGQPPTEAEQNEDEDTAESSIPIDRNKSRATSTEGQEFPDSLLRWARLAPSLRDEDLGGYLHLAASFAGQTVLDGEIFVQRSGDGWTDFLLTVHQTG